MEKEGITMFSGVFRTDVDLPYLNAVNVDATGYSVNDSFQQLFNHYHCATMPVYDASQNEMHTVFFWWHCAVLYGKWANHKG